MASQYKTPAVPTEWSASRETHPAVAMAIHAIADASRSPEAIWEEPTKAEWEHVAMAVEQYIRAGLVEPEPDSCYPWGEEIVALTNLRPATIEERGNGLCDEGEFVSGADGELYRVVRFTGSIQTGRPGQGNRIRALVELADWDDVTDETEPYCSACSAVIGAGDE